MKITSANLKRYDLKLRHPYTIAYEVVEKATNFVLELGTDKGLVGFGCAQPDPVVTGENPAMVEKAFSSIIEPALLGENVWHYARIIDELQMAMPKHSSSLAMVDMALYDLMAKKAEVPLYQFLGGYRQKIETSITIGICPLDETLEEAKNYLSQGFTILKIKGGKQVEEDIERIIKLRELYPNIRLRFDGNQGYSLKESLHFLNETKKAGIEIFEQPTTIHNEERLGAVTDGTNIPVMADESIKSLADTYRLVSNERIDMINIKIMKVGGILEAMHINSVAKSDKVEVMVGCIDESALGISAGLHFALSRPNIQYADLDGHLDFISDPFAGLFHIENGWMWANDKFGLGV